MRIFIWGIKINLMLLNPPVGCVFVAPSNGRSVQGAVEGGVRDGAGGARRQGAAGRGLAQSLNVETAQRVRVRTRGSHQSARVRICNMYKTYGILKQCSQYLFSVNGDQFCYGLIKNIRN